MGAVPGHLAAVAGSAAGGIPRLGSSKPGTACGIRGKIVAGTGVPWGIPP